MWAKLFDSVKFLEAFRENLFQWWFFIANELFIKYRGEKEKLDFDDIE